MSAKTSTDPRSPSSSTVGRVRVQIRQIRRDIVAPEQRAGQGPPAVEDLVGQLAPQHQVVGQALAGGLLGQRVERLDAAGGEGEQVVRVGRYSPMNVSPCVRAGGGDGGHRVTPGTATSQGKPTLRDRRRRRVGTYSPVRLRTALTTPRTAFSVAAIGDTTASPTPTMRSTRSTIASSRSTTPISRGASSSIRVMVALNRSSVASSPSVDWFRSVSVSEGSASRASTCPTVTSALSAACARVLSRCCAGRARWVPTSPFADGRPG